MIPPAGPPPDPAQAAVFDAETLAELEALFGRSRLMELLDVLDREIAARLDPPASEPSQLAQDAHNLVSSSGGLSFHSLSEACAALEQACLSGAEIAAPLGNAVHAARHARKAIATLRAA
jgi:HPt (histidine-containing phosphotransfer) domain-containing protein